ncbi:hypothetical protein DFA_06068 [Cavenderia fasciculata]|uniref:RING-type E3 ubiquitin transferase n=1 Tax=Cavenderia fasciculata TaxID=261658 RepID=F4PK06_CACFS|nr:uncharacterized protein DFA_06068 [Cavenderia fasciculata]EGG23930.1 hypothetical protein DFA_06068 [Cavenderia fasciculata]|eukprot:XP_004361781.1 hypothetical protein DFA_06068 [Cavenderia fasciculata]
MSFTSSSSSVVCVLPTSADSQQKDKYASTSSATSTYSQSSAAMTSGSSGNENTLLHTNNNATGETLTDSSGSNNAGGVPSIGSGINNSQGSSSSSSGDSSSSSSQQVQTEQYPRNITFIYKGDWSVNNGSSLATLSFTKNTGHTLFSIINYPLQTSSNVDFVEGEMVIRDGVYTTDTTKKYFLYGIYEYKIGLLTLIALPNNIHYSTSIQFSDNSTVPEIRDILNKILSNITSTNDCGFNVNIQFESLSSDVQESNENQIRLSGSYVSTFCMLDIKIEAASILLSVYQSKRINYILMVTLCSFIQIFVLIKQMDYTGTQTGAAKVSLYTVGMQTIIDAYLCLIHLTAGIVIESMFNAFATAAFFQFVSFSLFGMRYLLIILKARRPQAFADGWHSLRREFSIFYLRFYSFLIGGFMIIYYMSHLFHLFLFIMYSFWVPQIYNNATRCTRRPFLWQYVLGMSFSRLAIPLYFFGCPYNFIPVEPDYTFSLMLFNWMCLQIFVLYLQEKWGPQFFIPKRFLPPKYQYARQIAPTIRDGQQCVICMCDVEADDNDYMITPCDHLFHSRCLLEWIEYKMSCPPSYGTQSFNNQFFDSLSSLQYLRVVKDGIQFKGRFIDVALSDGRPTYSQTQLLSTSKLNDEQAIVLIGIGFPQCSEECILDPDFSALIVDTDNGQCNSDSKKWSMIVGIVVGVVGAVALSIIILYGIKKYKRYLLLNQKSITMTNIKN